MKAVVLLATLLLGLLGAAPAEAAEARVWIHLYAEQQGAQGTYVPPQQNSSQPGIQGKVTRLGPGGYRVDLAGAGASGIPMVTAVNSSGVHCQLTSFEQNGTAEVVYVGCYAGEVPTNSKFTLSFFSSTPPDSGADGAYGYVYNNQPALNFYANPPGYNSSGRPIEIYHAVDTNIWTVRFFGDQYNNTAGNVQVTSIGAVPARCAVSQWYPHALGADAQVRCDRPNGNDGAPPWALTYTHDRSIMGGTGGFFGYLQADQPTSPAYTPTEPRNRGQDGYIHTVTRSGTGKYQVQLNGPIKAPVAVQLSVNGNTDNYCVLNNWSLTGGDRPAARVNLSCYNANRNPVDSWYALNYFAS